MKLQTHSYKIVGIALILIFLFSIFYYLSRESNKSQVYGGTLILPLWFPAPDYQPNISLEEAVKAAQRTPNNPMVHFYLSILYAQRGDWSNSLKASQSLIRLAPQDSNGYLGAAYAYVHLGKPQEALRVLAEGIRTIKDEWTRAYLHRACGDVWLYLYEQNRDIHALVEAEKAYNLALGKNPEVALARIGLARVALHSNRLREAEEQIEAALRVATTKREKALAYYYLGTLYERQGNSQAASDWYAKAFKTSPNSFDNILAHIFIIVFISVNQEKTANQFVDHLRMHRYEQAAVLLAPSSGITAEVLRARWESVERAIGRVQKVVPFRKQATKDVSQMEFTYHLLGEKHRKGEITLQVIWDGGTSSAWISGVSFKE